MSRKKTENWWEELEYEERDAGGSWKWPSSCQMHKSGTYCVLGQKSPSDAHTTHIS